jgi:hypothetical protein
MSFVDCYLPYFRQQLITCLLLALLPFQSLFTESSHGDQLLASSQVCFPHPSPFAVCSFSVPCLLFRFFLQGGGLLCPGGYADLSQGWLGEYHVPLICSPVGLLNISQAGL